MRRLGPWRRRRRLEFLLGRRRAFRPLRLRPSPRLLHRRGQMLLFHRWWCRRRLLLLRPGPRRLGLGLGHGGRRDRGLWSTVLRPPGLRLPGLLDIRLL